MSPRPFSARLFASAAAAILALVSIAGRAVAKPPLADLHDVSDLAAAFNRDAGRFRVVILASPT